MKINRQIGLLTLLLQREKITANELAKKFEVDRRTIYRDIEEMCAAGIPLTCTRGRGGGIFIMENYKLDKTLLTYDDMAAVLTGLKSLDSVYPDNRYKHIMEKFTAGAPDMLNAGGNIIIDLSKWGKSAVSEKIAIINNNIENHVKISFDYFSPSGNTKRTIEPYCLIFRWSDWYVWGYCLLRNDFRLFRLSRMADLFVTGENFEIREIPPYIPESMSYKEPVTCSVRFNPDVKWRLVDEFGADNFTESPDGFIEKTFNWLDLPSFFSYILSFGDKAEIINPEEYRIKYAEMLKKMSEMYKG